jgi:mono/diheme cytochrome c family protein
MRSRLAILLAMPCLAGLFAADKDSKEPARIAYSKQIAPLLQKYCMQCHSGAKPKGSFSLDKIQGEGDRKTWEKVIGVLNAREMPPEAKPQPSAAERDLLRGFLEQQLAAVDCSKGRNPGRVTIRRLNRAEYDNTIRDLLGVDFKPSDDFPADDVGYGFDNIGDVLSMSPLLVEKYLSAAERIVEQALIKREGGPPVRRYQLGELQGDGALFIQSNYRLLTEKGSVFIQHAFPQDAEYVLRVRAHGEQAGGEPVKMVFRLDGKDLLATDIKESGPRSAKVHEVKTRVTRGNHRLAAFFLNPFSDEKVKRNRQLAITFLEVESPLSAAPPDARAKLFFVTPSDKVAKDEAARKVLEGFTRRAFRRPVTGREIDRYLKLFQLADKQGEPFDRAIGVAVQGALCSPHFLFRIEKGPAPGETVRTLDEHELAVRLSYFLWSSMPDEELFALAEKGELRKNLEAQVRRMILDEKAAALTDNFAGQWLQTRSLRTFNPDPNLFPNFDARLRDAMIKEVDLFFGAVAKEDRSILHFLDADFTFVNEPLARHYGIKNVSGQQFRRVELKDTPRGGVLTMAAVLASTSNPTRTSPVKRGKWILENILNAPPPPPPPDAGELSEEKSAVESASLRQRMELHRSKPACAQCHARMDAMGFAFENFDALGGWRTMDGKFPIDPAGTLPGGESFKGAGELKNVLKGQSEVFARCLTEKMLTYALGRGVEYADKCAIDDAVDALKKDGYRFSRLVLEIVRSDPFQKRRGK